MRYDSAVVYYRKVVNDYPYSKYAEYLKPRMQYALKETSKPAVKQENKVLLNNPTPLPPGGQVAKSLQDTVSTIPPIPKPPVQKVPKKK